MVLGACLWYVLLCPGWRDVIVLPGLCVSVALMTLESFGCSNTLEPLHGFAKILLQIKYRTWFLTVFSFVCIFRQSVLWKHTGE